MSSNSAISSSSSNGSWWTKVQSCLCSKRTCQTTKIGLWFASSLGSLLIPVRGLDGFLWNSMVFMVGHEALQHPDLVCKDDRCKSITSSRTWRHISAGATISGIGGLGKLALSTNLSGLGLLAIIAGWVVGFTTAYTDICFTGNYRAHRTAELAPPTLPTIEEETQQTMADQA